MSSSTKTKGLVMVVSGLTSVVRSTSSELQKGSGRLTRKRM